MSTLLEKLRYPIMQAPIGSACSIDLASAVTRAGALGSLAMTGEKASATAELCESMNQSVSGLWAANFVMASACPGLPAAVEAGAPVITLSWGMPKPVVDMVKRSTTLLGVQVGSSQGALEAARLGADFLICQGIEAGGHVQSSTPLLTLLREVVALKIGLPLIGAGGIGNGDDVRSVLDAGADIAALGTRFVNALESRAHPEYQQAIVNASEADTAFTCCFDRGWPNANSRVLRNSTLTRWEAEGCPPPGRRSGEDDVIATTVAGRELLRYSIASPVCTTVGRVMDLALYAGTSCERVSDVLPAAEIINQLVTQSANQAVA